MHRVELKESIVPGLFRTVTLVPNAPCGVESSFFVIGLIAFNSVCS